MKESLQELHFKSIVLYIQHMFGFLTQKEYEREIRSLDRKIERILFNYHC